MREDIPLRELNISDVWAEVQKLRSELQTHNHLTSGSLMLNGEVSGILQSPNFVSGSSGWQIMPNGNVEFNSGNFRGDISGATGTFTGGIAVGTSPNWFKVDADGNIWSGNATLAGAKTNTFAVEKEGLLYAKAATIAGSTISTPTITGIQSGSEIAIQGWQQDMAFSATDADTVAWATGTITLLDGTTYSITGANTGNMTALTYIYLDIATSVTLLQITTTAATAVGTGKILIAVAQNNSDATSKATFQVFGGKGGLMTIVDNIAANSASTNEFISNTAQIKDAIINNAKITDLNVNKLLAGSITSKAITLAVAAGTGDSYIAGGNALDLANWRGGDANGGAFILGLDDSVANDPAKFFIGNYSLNDYLSYDPTDKLKIVTTAADAIIIDYGSDILLREGGDIKFTSVTAPTACTATLVATSTGNIDAGTHIYKVTYVTATGETELGAASNTVTTDATHKQVDLSAIPVSSSGSVTSRKIYRTKAGASNYYLLTTIADNTTTTYTDNIADASLTGGSANNKENDTFGKIIINGIKTLSLGQNTFVGYDSGHSNTTGYLNSAIGKWTLYNNTIGKENSAMGTQTLQFNTTGHSNSAMGASALHSNTTGNDNSAMGANALYDNSTGSRNIAFGYYAGRYETGSDAFYVNNQDRIDTAGDKAKSLLYGVMNADQTLQTLQINANLKIGAGDVRATTVGTRVFDIFDGTAPAGTLANGISLYSTAGELRVMDAAGNATLLSPHNKKTNEWIYDSIDNNGKRLRIDMEKMMKAINDKFGWDFIKEYKL